jgi:rubrerythrin
VWWFVLGGIILRRGKTMSKKIVKQMAEEYVDTLDTDLAVVMKHTFKNIYEWAVNGKSKSEIAKYLNLTPKEWQEMTKRYPEALGAFAKGKEFANTMLSMSMYELAMGQEFISREVVTKDGVVMLKEQIPPNVRFNALKFLLETQVPETYGKHIASSDQNDYAKMFTSLSDAEKKALMLIEKKETIRTTEIIRKESPIVDTQTGVIINEKD